VEEAEAEEEEEEEGGGRGKSLKASLSCRGSRRVSGRPILLTDFHSNSGGRGVNSILPEVGKTRFAPDARTE